MAGPPPTRLPVDPAQSELDGGTSAVDVVRANPASPAAWAALAAQAQEQGLDAVTVYAYARVGYHRSLDMLRRNGWKGHGPVPWEHEPNRGFLRCLALLAVSALGDRRDRRVGPLLGVPGRLQPDRPSDPARRRRYDLRSVRTFAGPSAMNSVGRRGAAVGVDEQVVEQLEERLLVALDLVSGRVVET